jgi:hypothetical protein
MEQKVMITDSQYDVQKVLDNGWKVVSVTAQHVSNSSGGQTYNTTTNYGKFCFILERGV